MLIEHKDATIVATGTDKDFPGTFEVILSTPNLDRDGDVFRTDEWELPLPAKIPFDLDHGMSVATTVGSGVPSFDDQGRLVVAGTFSSLQQAQDVRTLVQEGHIDKTSVAYVTHRTPVKGGPSRVSRALLNGAFVAIPANDEAVVLSSKGLKTGARNSASDAKQIQAIHDATASLGAACAAEKSFTVGRKDADTEDQSDPVALIQATDAAIDQAIDLFATVDITTLPAEVQQAIALVQAADTAIDELMDVAGITDPDEDAEPAAPEDPAAAAKAAAAVESKAAADAESDAVTDEEIEAKTLALVAAQFS